MKVFDHYSQYYDLLYRDKDYSGEVDFLDRIIKRYRPESKTILDLGCGTGRHALLLKEKGYIVHGVDRSDTMIELASQNTDGQKLNFSLGDIRTVRMEKSFDVVISIFHVMSYQITNHDLQEAFFTASSHLQAGGIFIFDFWYGPAVLTERPSVRIKRMESTSAELTRLAEPKLHVNSNTVDVNYHVFIKDKQTGKVSEIKETHCMRYLFKPEIDYLFDRNGFHCCEFRSWEEDSEPSLSNWNVYCVGKK